MQIKTIERTIKKKLESWLETITDKHLSDDVRDNLLVSGGSIASMLLNTPVNDYDIYLMDMDVCKRLAEYYIANHLDEIELWDGRESQKMIESFNAQYLKDNQVEMPIDGNTRQAVALRTLKDDQIKLYFKVDYAGLKVEAVKDKPYSPIYFSPNAISLSNDIQVVLRFWGTPEQIHSTFDYIHATNYFTFKNGLVRNIQALESILTKQLRYQGSYYPLTSIIRAKKFITRGFTISAGELLKIMFQISQLDLTNPDVLEEQLIGVDVAYFDKVITALRNKMDGTNDFKLSTEYFNELIDRIFNSNDEDGQ